jgi:hypothetical protein
MTYTSDPSKEFVRLGKEIYARSVRSLVEPDHAGEFVAIDIDSGAWELHADDFTATQRLLATRPKARIWLVRVGSPGAYRIGGSSAAEKGG